MDTERAPHADDAVTALVAGVRARQLAVFHVVGVAAFAAYTGFWYAAGVDGAAQVCGAGLAAMLLNMTLGGRRWRAAASADVAIGIAALSAFVMAVTLWHDVPIIVSWSVFAPMFGWLLGSPRRAVLWAGVVTSLVVVGGVLVYREPAAARVAQLSYEQTVVFTCVHAISMVAIAIAAMWMLDQSHRLYLATMQHQQAELRATNVRLADTQRYKDRFYQAMSHELRTPMNAISGIAELLDDDHHLASPGERRELAASLRQSATHLSGIVSDVLDLTHMNERQFKLAIADFDLHEAITSAVATARAGAAAGPEVSVAVELTAAPRPVRGDRRRLIQVVTTLVGNALKHTPRGAVVVAARLGPATAPGDDLPVTIEVRDTGRGMSEEVQAQLRATLAGEPTTSMTGLSLLIAHRVTERMRGQLRFTSTIDVGTRFMIELALAPAASPARVVVPTAADERLRFLVVDDNRLNVLVASKLLARLSPGAVIDTAEDGEAALARVHAGPYHLILMDMQMPVMDGETATRHIRALADPVRAAIPIVAMTANTDSADLQRCLDAGMNQTLSKPVTALSLRQIVRAFLGRGAISSDKWPRVTAT